MLTVDCSLRTAAHHRSGSGHSLSEPGFLGQFVPKVPSHPVQNCLLRSRWRRSPPGATPHPSPSPLIILGCVLTICIDPLPPPHLSTQDPSHVSCEYTQWFHNELYPAHSLLCVPHRGPCAESPNPPSCLLLPNANE